VAGKILGWQELITFVINTWRVLIILLVMFQVLFAPLSISYVLATEDAVVNLTVTACTGGIVNFSVIYVNDQQLDLTWDYEGDAVAVMIRAKYGSYPENIPDIYTEPSDGYLVYSGNATMASDMSVDLDENSGDIYYAAWGQRADGTWYTDLKTDKEENRNVILLGILAFAAIISYIAFRSNFFGFKLIGGMTWFPGIWMYFKNNPPSTITEGSGMHTVILLLCIGFGVMIVLSGLGRGIQRTEKWENGEETISGFKSPNWMRNVFKNEVEEERLTNIRKINDYEDRMDRALGLGKYSRRR